MDDVDSKLEKIIIEFIKNRTNKNESTTSRHIHRRFDIPINDAEKILTSLSEKNIIKGFYDDEYQENRYNIIE